MAWLNVHPEISHVVIAQHWSARYDSKNVMDWKLKPLPSGEPAYSNSLRAFISELRRWQASHPAGPHSAHQAK